MGKWFLRKSLNGFFCSYIFMVLWSFPWWPSPCASLSENKDHHSYVTMHPWSFECLWGYCRWTANGKKTHYQAATLTPIKWLSPLQGRGPGRSHDYGYKQVFGQFRLFYFFNIVISYTRGLDIWQDQQMFVSNVSVLYVHVYVWISFTGTKRFYLIFTQHNMESLAPYCS